MKRSVIFIGLFLVLVLGVSVLISGFSFGDWLEKISNNKITGQATDTEGSLKFTTTHSGSGNMYTYFLIYDNAGYAIQSGDFLEYDIYCVPGGLCTGGTEIEGTLPSAWTGRWDLVDQNKRSNTYSNIATYAGGKWYHRKVDLGGKVGNVIKEVSVVEEGGVGTTVYYYKNIAITNNGVQKISFYSNGEPQSNALNYQLQASGYSVSAVGATSETTTSGTNVITTIGGGTTVDGCSLIGQDIINAINSSVEQTEGNYVLVGNYLVIPGHLLQVGSIYNFSFGFVNDKVRFADSNPYVYRIYDAIITTEGQGTLTIDGVSYSLTYFADENVHITGRVKLDFPQTTEPTKMTFYCGGTTTIGTCGDKLKNQASEQCDDGNTVNGDGCSATCQTEVTTTATGTQKTCAQTKTFKRQPTNLCAADETIGYKKSYRECATRYWWGGCRQYRTVYDYTCTKTTQTSCSANAVCPTGTTQTSTKQCTLHNIFLSSDTPTADVTVAGKTYTIGLISASDTAATVKVTDVTNPSAPITAPAQEISETSSKTINKINVYLVAADETVSKLTAQLIVSQV